MWGGQASAVLKSSSFVGGMAGMCGMGYLGDVLGIDPAFAITSLLMVVFALMSGCIGGSGDGDDEGDDQAMSLLLTARFFLGVGIGGCYPLASSKGNEECGHEGVLEKNQAVGLIFFWQSIGDLFPYVVGMVVSALGAATGGPLAPGGDMGGGLGYVGSYRVCVILGCLPPAVVLWLALKTSGRQKEGEEQLVPGGGGGSSGGGGVGGDGDGGVVVASSSGGNRKKAAATSSAAGRTFFEQVRVGFQEPRATENFLATSVCWMLYDVAYYGSNQFTPKMTEKVFSGSESSGDCGFGGGGGDGGGGEGDSGGDNSTFSGNFTASDDGCGVLREDIFGDSWKGAVDMAVGVPATLHALWLLRCVSPPIQLGEADRCATETVLMPTCFCLNYAVVSQILGHQEGADVRPP
jgi:MFS family permease